MPASVLAKYASAAQMSVRLIVFVNASGFRIIIGILFQLRLDFETFVINGPTTASTSVFHILGGQVIGRANGVAVSIGTQCLTDTFQISNQANLPLICGTMTGEHGNDKHFDFGPT